MHRQDSNQLHRTALTSTHPNPSFSRLRDYADKKAYRKALKVWEAKLRAVRTNAAREVVQLSKKLSHSFTGSASEIRCVCLHSAHQRRAAECLVCCLVAGRYGSSRATWTVSVASRTTTARGVRWTTFTRYRHILTKGQCRPYTNHYSHHDPGTCGVARKRRRWMDPRQDQEAL